MNPDVPPEVKAAFLEATDKQKKLAVGLGKGMNRKDAMLEAGYSKEQSRKCLKSVVEHPVVMTLAAHYSQQAIAKNEVTVERVVEEMACIALFDPADIMDDTDNVLPIRSWPVEARRAFAGWDSAGRPKFANKVDAAERLEKIKGWAAPDKVEIKAVVGVVVVPQKGGMVIDVETMAPALPG